MDELIKDFLVESRENLDRLDQELVKLESDPSSRELLSSIFRTIHTIKGSCGFLGFSKLEKVAHTGESLLSLLRDGQIILTGEITTGLLSMVDAVRHMMGEIEAAGGDGENNYSELVAVLTSLQQPSKAGKTSAGIAAPRQESHSSAPAGNNVSSSAKSGGNAQPIDSTPAAGAEVRDAAKYAASKGKIGGLLVERGLVSPQDVARALREQEQGDRRKLGEILAGLGVAKMDNIQRAVQSLEESRRETASETLRVDVKLLDKLMTLVGELVLARNQLLQYSATSEDARFQSISQHMNLIASELQEEVMKTRMQPIGNIWSKFPRTVRDVASSCLKEVRIEMEGEATELDKTIIEAIKDPLTHLVRNAVDHGIEPPDVRAKAGKSRTGLLVLRAFHEGGQVNIEITDDGAGLNREKIRAKAIERSLVPPEQAARMTDHELF